MIFRRKGFLLRIETKREDGEKRKIKKEMTNKMSRKRQETLYMV